MTAAEAMAAEFRLPDPATFHKELFECVEAGPLPEYVREGPPSPFGPPVRRRVFRRRASRFRYFASGLPRVYTIWGWEEVRGG